MNKIKLLFLTLFFIALCQGAKAQFSIPGVPPSQTEGEYALDTVILMPASPIDIEYFDRARWMAERRALRKERNTFEFNSALQMSQTQFDNWASGGDNTFSARATLYIYHKYQRAKYVLETKFEARYGLSYIEKKQFKNEDEFKLNLLYSYELKGNWSYAAMANFRSQFATSYKSRDDRTRISTLMAPGFLEVSLGFKYERKPFTLVLSPVSGNAVFVLDDELSDQGINGVTPGSRSHWSIGPSLQAAVDWTFAKEVCRLRSTLYAFTNVKKAPLMRWETTFDIQATKFLTTTLYGFVNYDRESNAPKPRQLQYKYAFAVGLAYTFKNK